MFSFFSKTKHSTKTKDWQRRIKQIEKGLILLLFGVGLLVCFGAFFSFIKEGIKRNKDKLRIFSTPKTDHEHSISKTNNALTFRERRHLQESTNNVEISYCGIGWPHLASRSDNTFVLSWVSDAQKSYFIDRNAGIYTAYGEKIANISIDSSNAIMESVSSKGVITSLNDNGFVELWKSSQSSKAYFKRYDSQGKAITEILKVANDTQNDHYYYEPSITRTSSGGFFITFSLGISDGIYGQRYDATTAPIGGLFQINNLADCSIDQNGQIANLAGGGSVSVWICLDQSAYPFYKYQVVGQRYNSAGAAIGSNFVINSAVSPSPSFFSSVAALTDGGFVVAYKGKISGSYDNVFGQRYTSGGSKTGSEFQINTQTSVLLYAAKVVGLKDGGFIATWSTYDSSTNNKLYSQRYQSNGAKLGGEFLISPMYGQNYYRFIDPDIIGLEDGGFVVSWGGGNLNDTYCGIYTKIFDQDGVLRSTISFTLPPYPRAAMPNFEALFIGLIATCGVICCLPCCTITIGCVVYAIGGCECCCDKPFQNAPIAMSPKNKKTDKPKRGTVPTINTKPSVPTKSNISFLHDTSNIEPLVPTLSINPIDNDSQGDIPLTFQLPIISSKDLKINYHKTLGKGGFGVVRPATYQGEPVAVKILNIQSISEKLKKEFEKEIQLMARLSFHPRIVRIYGINSYNLVVELMHVSLFQFLQGQQKISWKILAPIVLDIAHGVQFLHSQKVVHRDLKSPNILLDKNFRAKITDFGLSKYSNQRSSQKNEYVGTISWMPAEVLKGGEWTVAGDIYSLGMVFYEIVTRQIPFANASSPQIAISWIIQGVHPKIPKGKCPPKLAPLIKQCWAEQIKRPSIDKICTYLQENAQTNSDFVPSSSQVNN